MSELRPCFYQAMVHLIYLIGCFLEKSDMEIFWVRRYLTFKCTRITQDECKAMPIGHDGDRIAFLLQKLEIEAVLEGGLSFTQEKSQQ